MSSLLRPSKLAALGLVGALCVAFAAPGCKKPEQAQADSDKAAGVEPVKTQFGKVEEREVPPRLDVTGTLDPDDRSDIAAQTAGVVSAVNVDIGTRVKKGDVLIELDAREAALKLNAAAATAESQRARLGLEGREKFDPENVADVRAAREARDLANTEYERSKALFDSGAISQASLDMAKTNKERSDAAYDSARNGAQQAWSTMLASQSQAGLSSKSVDDTKIRAPFDGVIGDKKIGLGEFASMGRVVAVVVRDNPLRFRFDVPEEDSGSIAIGNPVELSVDAFKGRSFHGVVKRIGASVMVQTRTLPVEAEVPNDDLALRPGFFARARIALGGDPKKALFVPGSAVSPIGSGFRVFVKKGDHVVEKLVTIASFGGAEADDKAVEVRGDLKPGDEVATENVDQLADGVPWAQ